MNTNPDTINTDRTPRASLGNDEADQAGSCCYKPKFLTYPELLEKTISAGLDLGTYSHDEALILFKRYGYYHLRGFWVSLENSGLHNLIWNTCDERFGDVLVASSADAGGRGNALTFINNGT